MKIIISPAKQMKMNMDSLEWESLPEFIERSERLREYIASLTYDEQKKLWQCNDKIAKLNSERFMKMELCGSLTPAILAYDGDTIYLYGSGCI